MYSLLGCKDCSPTMPGPCPAETVRERTVEVTPNYGRLQRSASGLTEQGAGPPSWPAEIGLGALSERGDRDASRTPGVALEREAEKVEMGVHASDVH